MRYHLKLLVHFMLLKAWYKHKQIITRILELQMDVYSLPAPEISRNTSGRTSCPASKYSSLYVTMINKLCATLKQSFASFGTTDSHLKR